MDDRGRYDCDKCPDKDRVRRRCPLVADRSKWAADLARRPSNARHPKACLRLKVHPEMFRLLRDALRYRHGGRPKAGGDGDQDNWWLEMVTEADHLLAEADARQAEGRHQDLLSEIRRGQAE